MARGRQDVISYGTPCFIEYDVAEKAFKDGTGAAEHANTWTDPPASLFPVRGPEYLKQSGTNMKDLKQASEEAPYECIGLNMFRTPKRYEHSALEVAETRRFLVSEPEDPEEEKDAGAAPKYLIICWLFSSMWKEHTCVQHVFRRRLPANGASPSLDASFKRFVNGDDETRNSMFKYIFKMVDAPAMMQSAVSNLGGERPVIIGKKLTTTYHRGKNYMEVDMDVGSSTVASMLNSIILKSINSTVMDCAWLMEGQKEEELPERVLAAVRWNWCAPDQCTVWLDEDGEKAAVQGPPPASTGGGWFG